MIEHSIEGEPVATPRFAERDWIIKAKLSPTSTIHSNCLYKIDCIHMRQRIHPNMIIIMIPKINEE